MNMDHINYGRVRQKSTVCIKEPRECVFSFATAHRDELPTVV